MFCGSDFVNAQNEAQRLHEQFHAKLDAAPAEIREKIIGAVGITPVMADIIRRQPAAVEMATYLADHRDEALRIARLSDDLQRYEMGRLSAAITPPKPPNIKPPPAPMKTLGGGNSAPIPIESMTDKQFSAMRRKEIAARNGR